jgi:MoxR-like ATPase
MVSRVSSSSRSEPADGSGDLPVAALNIPADPLATLGLFGLSRLAPVILGALVTGEPLLLIGPHGTAKTLLLTRIAAALALSCRHYNASLLNFDDLVGFPLPDGEKGLRYVTTPSAIWGAGAVIFDEISRCRPDIQNKLFPIIHERKAQGLPIEGLVYRWAAMNPPSGQDSEETDYRGSEPLDPALADRFTHIVPLQGWERLSESERIAVIRARDGDASRGESVLPSLLTRIRLCRDFTEESIGEDIARYVSILVGLVGNAGVSLSPRRGGMLYRAILATHAASLCLKPDSEASDSAWLAIVNAIPQRAQGIEVSETKLLAAHKEAWRLAGVRPDDPLKRILMTKDPVERLGLAVATPSLPRGEFSGVVADVIALLGPGAREAAVIHLFETGAVGRLAAAVAEQAGAIYREIATPVAFSEGMHASQPRYRAWQRLKNLLSKLDPGKPRDHLQANAMAALFRKKELTTEDQAERAFNAFAETDRRVRGGTSHAG